MLSRREMMTATVAGSLSPNVVPTAAVPETPDARAAATALEQDASRDGQREIARAVGGLESTMRDAFMTNSVAFGVVGKVRANMDTFLRGNGKFPDFMDVGILVFWELYDWHIKNQQQLVVTRGTDGRYWMQFIFTTVLLRPEVEPGHIGVPFDKA